MYEIKHYRNFTIYEVDIEFILNCFFFLNSHQFVCLKFQENGICIEDIKGKKSFYCNCDFRIVNKKFFEISIVLKNRDFFEKFNFENNYYYIVCYEVEGIYLVDVLGLDKIFKNLRN